MHVSGFPFDLYPFLQFIFTAFVIAIAILHLVKNTASKYFTVEANFEEGGGGTREIILRNRLKKNSNQMVAVATCGDSCAVCGKSGNKQCSRCKRVRYCSGTCQTKHWKEGHSRKCQELSLFGGLNSTLSVSSSGMKTSAATKSAKELPQLKKVLFPYEEFVKLFSWGKGGFPPCGLINCGNSCYANVVLQCLSCTRPLIAYLLEIGHEKKCRRNDWCFLCELEHHVERASHHSSRPFSPINILSRLPNIGGNLGYGKQEDAHEFMRFAIDTMQSVCLDEYGGEKAIHPDSQETTLIQYIFGGQLQSQVKCSKCNKISYRHENMMDLTVEIQGDAESLVECLDQFTAEECLDGDNMYKCDGCNDYVKACKRLAIHCAPNVLTIALKRFQSGRFGKLNKRVTFPETLDLGPYMSEPGHGTDLYRLYAVVVHIDMLNASYFGHYICYTKDFSGNWYRNDDCKITPVELEEVLSQGAYMLLYSRVSPRPCVKSLESREEKQQLIEEAQSSSQANFESVASEPSIGLPADLRSPAEEEKKQDLVAINEAKPSSGLPVVECIKVYGPLNSLSSTGTDVRSSTIESSSVKDDLVCMNIDNPNEVNSRFLENDTTCTAADVPVSPESRSLDMDLDGPTRFDPRGFQPGHEMSNLELGSFGMNMENYDNKHSDTNVRSSVEILRETSPLTEVHLDGEPSVMNSDDKSFEDDAGMGNQESVSNEVSADHDVPIQSESVGKFIHGTNSSSFHCLPHPMSEQLQPDTIPCSGLESAGTYIPRKNSSSFDCLPHSMSEQLQAVKPVNVTTAAQVLKRNSSKLVGEKSYSNGKQKPLFSRGFLDKQIRCKSPNMKGKVVIEPGEVDMPSKANGNCNGFSKPGVTSVVHDQNGTISPDGLHVPAYVNGRSEKCSNGVGPSNSLSSHEAEIVPVTSVHTFPVSAPSPGSFLPTEVHDFGYQRKSLEFNLNGNSVYNSASEQVGSLPIQMDQEMDVISSEVPVVVSSSDIEMLDETNVTSFRSERSPSLVHTTIESNGYVNAAQNIDLLSSNAQDGSLGFMEKQTEGNCQNNNDASDGQGEVGFSYKASYCNGSADPGSCFEDGRQVNNHDRKFECSSINTAAHKAGDHLPWIQCNGNGTHNDDDGNMTCKKDQGGVMFCNNSENLLSPGSWKKSPMKGEEISSLNDIVSSNHDGNKLAGVV